MDTNTVLVPQSCVHKQGDIGPCSIDILALSRHLSTAHINTLINLWADRLTVAVDKRHEKFPDPRDSMFVGFNGPFIQLTVREDVVTYLEDAVQ